MKYLLTLCWTLLLAINSFAQLYQEDFEGFANGTGSAATGFSNAANGSSEVITGTNGTQTLRSSNTTGGDQFLRSPFFTVTEGKSYRISFDISVTNSVYIVRVRTKDSNGQPVLLPTSAVTVVPANGSLTPTNSARVQNASPNTFGTTTATFTVPVGVTKAQLQLYQFGVNSMELDNVLAEAYPFTPPIIDLSLTKQRIEPGETIDIIVTSDNWPVDEPITFAVDLTGLPATGFQLSDNQITLQPGQRNGSVQFTPDAGLKEEDVQISISTNTADVLLNTPQASAKITSTPRVIYVNSSEGDDSNDGFSEATPLQTLARVTELGQITGDHILFQKGDVFYGQLALTAGGTSSAPMVVSSYGEGEQPILDGSISADGKGSFRETILIEEQSHIELSDLHITNPRSTSRDGVPDVIANGIFILNDQGGIMKNLTFRNLTLTEIFSVSDIRQVEFNAIQVTGIFAETTNNSPGSVKYMADITVEDCSFSKIGKLGFWARRRFTGAETLDRETIKNRNIIFRNNTVIDNGGSGVVLSNARNALVEANTFTRTGSALIPEKMIGRGSGAWFFRCTNVVAQHNISRSVRGQGDSYGMHIDYGNVNVLFQYNYSEDSEGGFVEILGDNINSIWRYNISVNDGLRNNKGNTLWISDFAGNQRTRSSENYIYNNSVYVGNGFTPDIELNGNDSYIYNNIFQTENGSTIGAELDINPNGGPVDVSNNLFSGAINPDFVALDPLAINADPQYVEPGALIPGGYQLFRFSPALKAGLNRVHPIFPEAGHGIFAHISATPQSDYFGNPLADEEGGLVTPIGAFSGKGLKINPLKGYASCEYALNGDQQWVIENPNPFTIAVNWSSKDGSLSGNLIASPGLTYFTTSAEEQLSKIRITWFDEMGKEKARSVAKSKCYATPQTVVLLPDTVKDCCWETSAVHLIYPNPATIGGVLNIGLTITTPGDARLSLISMDGQILQNWTKKVANGNNLLQLQLDHSTNATQMVTLKVEIHQQTITRKMMVLSGK